MLAVTRRARVHGGCRGFDRPLLAHAHTSKNTFTRQHLVPLIQAVIVERFILAFFVPFVQLCQPFLIGLLGCSANTRLVLIGTHNNIVPNVRVMALTLKALATLSQLATGTVQGIGAATFWHSIRHQSNSRCQRYTPALGVAIQSTFSLSSKDVGSKGLTSARVACNGTD